MELKEILCELNANLSNLEKQANTEACQHIQYEQELWDKVASEIFIRACDESIATYRQEEVEYVAVRASSYADAFMAERAKRLKGDVE